MTSTGNVVEIVLVVLVVYAIGILSRLTPGYLSAFGARATVC